MNTPLDKLMRLPEVKANVGLGRSSIYAGIKEGTFPAPVKLGKRAVAWRKSDIAQWMTARHVKGLALATLVVTSAIGAVVPQPGG